MKKTQTRSNSRFVYVMAVIAATGGLLFGFDTGVISGAIPFLQQDFGIGDGAVELITTAGLVGAVIGALCCGRLTDRLGRRTVILGSAVIFAVGALWSGFAPDTAHLVASRLFLGVAIGVSSFAVPLYIAEISPAYIRGTLVSMFQLMITLGVLISYLSDLYFADEECLSCWRPMFCAGVVPAAVLLVGMCRMPESPRWLLGRGVRGRAMRVLRRIEGDAAAEVAAGIDREIERSRGEQAEWRELFRPALRMPLLIAVGIMFFQQFVGINTVIYYSPKIFVMAGFDGAVSAIGAAVGVGVVNVAATLVSVRFVDRIGRRRLYFIGLAGIALSLFALAGSFRSEAAGGAATVVCMFLYVAFYAVSIGPLGWLIISEVFPQRVRGLGSSVGSLAVWIFNSIVSFTFFKIVDALTLPGMELSVGGETTGNPAGAFALYGLVALLALVWGWYFVPETKGVPLERIEEFWRRGGKPRELK